MYTLSGRNRSHDMRCGGANDSHTPNLGCTQEPQRKAAYCIDAVVCVGEKKREKLEKVEKVERVE